MKQRCLRERGGAGVGLPHFCRTAGDLCGRCMPGVIKAFVLRVAPFNTLTSYGCLLMHSHKHTQGSCCLIFGMGLHAVGQHKMCVASGADLCHVMSEHRDHVADKV